MVKYLDKIHEFVDKNYTELRIMNLNQRKKYFENTLRVILNNQDRRMNKYSIVSYTEGLSYISNRYAYAKTIQSKIIHLKEYGKLTIWENSVSKSRNKKLSFNFYTDLLIVYFPLSKHIQIGIKHYSK